MIDRTWPPPASPAADAIKSLRGAQSRAQGMQFEELLEAACEHYELAGAAAIEKTPEPMKPVKKMADGRFVACFIKKAQADFKGTLGPSGRAVAFDAKSTAGEHIRQSVVSTEQWRWLDVQEKMGALCFVMVSLRSEVYHRVPWAQWKAMKETYGRKYMTREELYKDTARLRFGFCAVHRDQKGNRLPPDAQAAIVRAPGVFFLEGVEPC